MAEDAKNAIRQQILNYVAENDIIKSSRVFCSELSIDHETFVGAMNSLIAKEMIVSTSTSVQGFALKDEGRDFLLNASYEYRIFSAVPEDGVAQKDLEKIVGAQVMKIGLNYCMKDKWLMMDKATKLLKRVKSDVEDTTVRKLQNLDQLSADDITLLKKRNLITPTQIFNYTLEKGPKFSRVVPKIEADITAEMIATGSWENTEFRKLNLGKQVAGKPPCGGNLHTLLKVRTSIKEIFLELGFQEMPTNNYIESSFWNFDSLFQPQQHPARDAHDTFFMRTPATSEQFPQDYLERVKTMHESGGNGSIGWRYDWSVDEAKKNILRTHTTAVSARMLYTLAQEKEFKPRKFFSIDKVFRNETLDATHLAEFHQIEGLVADYNLTLGNLMGIIKLFFEKMGITNIKFKPAYNPYTEPSMEIFSYHEGHKRWLEIGNSGVFRPEMLLPMGLPEGVRVIAWGLSLERPTMIKYKFPNIRDLVGHKVDISAVQKNRICRRELTN